MCEKETPTLQERQFARRYLDQIIRYLRSDMKSYSDAEQKGVSIGCGPLMLTAASGIDFLGSTCVPQAANMGPGLEGKNKAGFIYYVATFMGKIDQAYTAGVAEYLYAVARCGQVHEAIVKRGMLLRKGSGRKYHLKVLCISPGSSTSGPPIRSFYLAADEFARDFVASIDHFLAAFDQDNEIASTVIRRLREYETSLATLPEMPSVPEVSIDDHTYPELYERSSASPFNLSGDSTLRRDLWRHFPF